jgi:hypothetical protein
MEANSVTSSELLQEIKALRGDVQSLPDRIVVASSKEIKRELNEIWWTLVAVALAYGASNGRWVPVMWGVGGILLYALSKWLFRNRRK